MQLHKIIFLIETLSSTELLSRTLMELWMSGYEAERIPIGQIMTQLSENDMVSDTLRGSSPQNDHTATIDASSQNSISVPRSTLSHDGALSPDTIILHHPDTQQLTQTTLIVTDRGDLAEAALHHGFAVIGYLHEKNRDISFQGVRYLIEDISGLDARFCELAFCRAHDIPVTILETERCLVREITLDDLPRLYEIYADPAITSYMEALYADEAEERSYIQAYIENVYSFYNYGMWVVIRKADGQLIGRAGIEPKEDTAELGYVIAHEYQNQGYATEVCRAILTYAADCLSLPEVCAHVHKENAASLRICEKLKFQPVPSPKDSDMLLFRLRLN